MTDRDEMVRVVRDEIAGWPIGSGYYATSVSVDEAREMAAAVVGALAEQIGETDDRRSVSG